MTQQDMINELNKMVIGYNITWSAIKYDADKAIMKINAHLGAEYPMMSEIMVSPNHRYTLKYKNIDKPIFPERYILTVILPFIATEVLARDEEFTTIYNKYAMDFENGLFDMFQNEYNKVPLVFRQDSDVGVFFSKDVNEHKIRLEKDRELPEFKYNVYYHINTDKYNSTKQFTFDVNKYDYGSSVVVLDTTVLEFINGIYVYRFIGWSREPNGNIIHYPEEELKSISSDIHLYAMWKEVCILNITESGLISIKEEYKNSVKYLNIPIYVNGIRVTAISENFTVGTNVVYVSLPKTSLTIHKGAFSNSTLKEIIFPKYDYLRNYPHIKLFNECIKDTSISYLYLPYSITTIETLSINGVPVIDCEIPKEDKPVTWYKDWSNSDYIGGVINWGVNNG